MGEQFEITAQLDYCVMFTCEIIDDGYTLHLLETELANGKLKIEYDSSNSRKDDLYSNRVIKNPRGKVVALITEGSYYYHDEEWKIDADIERPYDGAAGTMIDDLNHQQKMKDNE